MERKDNPQDEKKNWMKGPAMGLLIFGSIAVADYLNIPTTVLGLYSEAKDSISGMFEGEESDSCESFYELTPHVRYDLVSGYMNGLDSLSTDSLLYRIDSVHQKRFLSYLIQNSNENERTEYFTFMYDKLTLDEKFEAAKRIAMKTVGLE